MSFFVVLTFFFFLHVNVRALALGRPGLGLGLGEQVAVVDEAHDDLVVVDHLAVHVLEELLLLGQELLELLGGHAAAGRAGLADRLELGPDPLLEDLEAVLAELGVQLGQVRDGAHRGQDCVVPEHGVLGAERGDHYGFVQSVHLLLWYEM